MAGAPASEVCTLPVEPPNVDPTHFERTYRDRQRAVVIRNATSHVRRADLFRAATSVAALRSDYGAALVTVSSANAFSYGRRQIPLRDYLDAMGSVDYGSESSSADIYYWFGEHGEELAPLLDRYPLPSLALHTSAESSLLALALSALGGASAAPPPPPPALSFGAAGDGSGVPFHHHNDGFAEVLHGAKRWLFHYGEEPPPEFEPNATSLSWIRVTLPRLPTRPLECTIYPGDLVYFPKGVWHATLNVGTTVFISTFL